MHSQKKIAYNVAWLLADRGGRLVLAFFVNIYVARQLGPEQFGFLSYAQATVSLLAFLSLLAIEAIVIRMLVEEPDKEAEILGSALALRLLGGLTSVLAALLLVLALPMQPLLATIIPLLAGITIFQSADIVDYWFRQRLTSRFPVIARLLTLMLGATMRVGATNSDTPVFWLALVSLAESAILAGALLLAFFKRAQGVSLFRLNRNRMHAILRQALPMILSAIAVATYVRFGYLVLGNTSGSGHVGQLAAASVAAETLHALPVAIAASYGPILLKKRTQSMALFDRSFSGLLRVFAAAGIAIAAITALIAEPLMPLMFGATYAESGSILTILVWSIIFVYLSVASELWLIGYGLQHYMLPKTLIAAAIYVALILLLIPRYSGSGAAVATVVAYSVSAFWSNLLFTPTRALFFLQLRALTFGRAQSPRPLTSTQDK